jgi:hypothetical protein
VHPEDATRQQIMNTIEAFLSKDPAEPEQKRKQRMPARAAAQLALLCYRMQDCSGLLLKQRLRCVAL